MAWFSWTSIVQQPSLSLYPTFHPAIASPPDGTPPGVSLKRIVLHAPNRRYVCCDSLRELLQVLICLHEVCPFILLRYIRNFLETFLALCLGISLVPQKYNVAIIRFCGMLVNAKASPTCPY